MQKVYPLLDHGYIKFVEAWGYGDSGRSEAAIIEAARMSTNKGFNGWDAVECIVCKLVLQNPQEHTSEPGVFCPNKYSFKDIGDKRLLKYLYENKHMTPFEMAGMTIEVCAPIFVFREWHRHRTQSYNEMSGRYIPLPNENYLPDFANLVQRAQATSANKQEQSITDYVSQADLKLWHEALEKHYENAEGVYQLGLRMGVPKELARLSVPVARYSRMRASGNLRNWLAFLTLRMDPKAQWEIRQYADIVGKIVSEVFPRTWKLFSNGQ